MPVRRRRVEPRDGTRASVRCEPSTGCAHRRPFGLTSEYAEAAARAIEKQSRKRTHHGAAQQLVTEEGGRRRISLDPMKRIDEGMTLEQQVRAYEQVFDTYLASIPPQLRRLVERFRRVDSVRQIVGVGSVGMRVWLHLMEGDSGRQPVFTQVKQATARRAATRWRSPMRAAATPRR